VSWRRQVRIAHAKIDDVGALIASRRLGAIHRFKHIRGQTADAIKLFHRRLLPAGLSIGRALTGF
jgi:hypothetical protein